MSNNPQASLVFDLYTQMSEERIISAYHGDFTQEVINMLLKQAKWDLSARQVSKSTLKKTYHILVECLENILKHKSLLKGPEDRNDSDGIVILALKDPDYLITVGNLIMTSDIAGLKEKIDLVNSLNKEDLKDLHTKTLRETTISERGGAGLGLIEIAMKSHDKLKYQFSSYNENLSFFCLQTTISSKSVLS
ncbi:MAG: SiaB family protein kinase [Flavobacteriales bacterium]|nr:SiaB family protein kinase [Flavobacteriales bacterium]